MSQQTKGSRLKFIQFLFGFARPARDVATNVDAYLTRLAQHGYFNGNVLIAQGNDLLFRHHYGTASDSRFLIGSITKQFTAVAIMQLQERGLLSVHETVERWFPHLPNAAQLTIDHLLSHCSGLGEYTTVEFWLNNHRADTIIDYVAQQPAKFPPGAAFDYCNSNYVILGAILERVTGQNYGSYMEEHIFRPCGMEHSGFNEAFATFPTAAVGYEMAHDQLVPSATDKVLVAGAAGGLYSTVDDLHRWQQALLTDTVLSADAKRDLWTVRKGRYAYGWLIPPLMKARLHSGRIDGFTSFAAYFEKQDIHVIVLSNYSHISLDLIANDIVAILFGHAYKEPLLHERTSAHDLARYVGTYVFDGGTITVDRVGDDLVITLPLEQPNTLHPTHGGKFFLQGRQPLLSFSHPQDGKFTQLEVAGMIAKKETTR